MHPTHVRFTPNSDRKSRHPQDCMSALPPKADMCGALANVRFGPIADIADCVINNDKPTAEVCAAVPYPTYSTQVPSTITTSAVNQ
jgi:hypothetical protein